MKKIKVSDVLPPSSTVHHVETPRERMIRLLLDHIQSLCALIVLVLGMLGLFVIIACLDDLRQEAFRTFTYLVVAAAGYFFGTNVSANSADRSE